MKNLKYCQACNQHLDREFFGLIKTVMGHRRRNRCLSCDARKERMSAVRSKEAKQVYDQREKELALIPNPFEKKQYVPMNTHPLLWTGNA